MYFQLIGFLAIRARLATVMGTLAFGVAARRSCGRLRHSLALLPQ